LFLCPPGEVNIARSSTPAGKGPHT
jgi:hypothetical protein